MSNSRWEAFQKYLNQLAEADVSYSKQVRQERPSSEVNEIEDIAFPSSNNIDNSGQQATMMGILQKVEADKQFAEDQAAQSDISAIYEQQQQEQAYKNEAAKSQAELQLLNEQSQQQKELEALQQIQAQQASQQQAYEAAKAAAAAKEKSAQAQAVAEAEAVASYQGVTGLPEPEKKPTQWTNTVDDTHIDPDAFSGWIDRSQSRPEPSHQWVNNETGEIWASDPNKRGDYQPGYKPAPNDGRMEWADDPRLNEWTRTPTTNVATSNDAAGDSNIKRAIADLNAAQAAKQAAYAKFLAEQATSMGGPVSRF